jgi:cysteine-rich repeat protein
MSGRRVAPLFLLPLLITACDGGDTKKPPPSSSTTGTSQGGGTGGAEGGTGGASAGAGGTAGMGGTGGSLPCGNGTIDVGEACDGAELGDATCETLGFPGGTLACSAACELDLSSCTGADDCTDGADNDGDGLTDCEEPDCQAACADACLAPVALVDPDDTWGSTVGHAGVLKPSCADESGSEVVYAITAVTTGMLDINVVEDGSASFSVSVRTDCASDASEIACTSAVTSSAELSKKLSIPVTAGQVVLAVVDALGAGAEGYFTIAVQSRPIECGDGIHDPPEGCDDGNTAAGDGCGAACTLESVETEPNDTLPTAAPFSAPYYASIDPVGDVDLVMIDLPTSSGLIVSTSGLGDLACFDGSMNSVVTILDAAGAPIATNDDVGGSACSTAAAAGLPAGVYYAKIEAASPVAPQAATFPYSLSVTTYQCGDTMVSPGEECDDGNTTSGDGCSAACAFEVVETEQNGTLATANVYTSPWVARIDPDNDVDVVSITVPGPASKLVAKTLGPDGSACSPGADTYVEILAPNGDVLAFNDDQGSYCSHATALDLASGTYYVRVKATPLLDQTIAYVFPYALDLTIQ